MKGYFWCLVEGKFIQLDKKLCAKIYNAFTWGLDGSGGS